MYDNNQISRVTSLELTTKCHARCPQCARNWRGDTNPRLPQIELSLADIQCIFPPSELQPFKSISVCGSYGDATAAQDTVDIMEYFRATKEKIHLKLHSHGSARSIDWWKKLAALDVAVFFGIDGLEDTNHIYRRETNWKTIMRNASAFINAGGRAYWDYLVFAHNEHQVETAEKLSQEMGFEKFLVKRTGRFQFRSSEKIFARDGKTVVGELRPSSQKKEFENRLWKHIKEDFNRDEYQDHLQTTPIFCKAKANGGGIYVSAEALVFPCCWLRQIYPNSPLKSESECEPLMLLEKIPGGRSAICALNHPISEIIRGPFFQHIVPDGWKAGPDRIHTCAYQCGSYIKSYQVKDGSPRDETGYAGSFIDC